MLTHIKKIKMEKCCQRFMTALFAIVLTFASINPVAISALNEEANPAAITKAGSVVDNPTLDDYKNLFPEGNASTQNVGRVWSDKTVLNKTEHILDGKGDIVVSIDPTKGEDFNVVFSTISSSKTIINKEDVGQDVSFILDISESMREKIDPAKKTRRIDAAVKQLNSSIETILSLNGNPRISVTIFSDDAVVKMPLSHYTKINDRDFVSVTTKETTNVWFRGIDENGHEISVKQKIGGGTNTQMGYAKGLEVLETENKTTEVINGHLTKRMPIVVMLTDGQPTYFSGDSKWWNQSAQKYGAGDDNQPHFGNGLLAMMTAAYKKQAINKNYNLSENENSAKIFTIGFGLESYEDDSKALVETTLNPNDNWNNPNEAINGNINRIVDCYVAGESPNFDIQKGWDEFEEFVEYENYILNHPDTGIDITKKDIKGYVDKYYLASNADELNRAFENIMNNIKSQSADYPTEINNGNPQESGYVTYTDPLGEYMEVKDIKSIIYNGKEYKVAYDSTAGIATCTGNCMIKHPVYGKADLKKVLINTTFDVQGKQIIEIKVPAAMIPLIINKIEIDPDKNIVSHTQSQATPIRVVYSVGLKEEIDREKFNGISEDYLYGNTKNGLTYFLCNEYTNGNEYGNAKITYKPNKSNPNYFIQNEKVLKDENNHEIVAIEDIDASKIYHFENEYYLGKSVATETIEIPGVNLKIKGAEEFLEVKNGRVVIKPGSARINHLDNFKKEKIANVTETAKYYYYPKYSYSKNELSFQQGNNGLLVLKEPASLIIKKQVSVGEGLNPTSKVFKFKLTIPSKGNSIVKAKIGSKTVSVEFVDGVATIELKQNESICIPKMTNEEYTIEEIEIPNGYTSDKQGNLVTGSVAAETATVNFLNSYDVTPLTVDFGTIGQKTISGRDFLDGDSYKFAIKAVNNGPLPTNEIVTINPTSGNRTVFGFGEFTFTKPGTYKYLIKEVDPSTSAIGEAIPGISYSSNREVYSYTSLPQGTRKISSKQSNLTPKGTRERRTNKTQS